MVKYIVYAVIKMEEVAEKVRNMGYKEVDGVYAKMPVVELEIGRKLEKHEIEEIEKTFDTIKDSERFSGMSISRFEVEEVDV